MEEESLDDHDDVSTPRKIIKKSSYSGIAASKITKAIYIYDSVLEVISITLDEYSKGQRDSSSATDFGNKLSFLADFVDQFKDKAILYL